MGLLYLDAVSLQHVTLTVSSLSTLRVFISALLLSARSLLVIYDDILNLLSVLLVVL